MLRWEPAGPPRGTVVLLHGVMSLGATWRRIGPGLAALGWEALAPDLSGHGEQPRLGRPLDLDTLVDGVEEQLRGPVDLLIGHSLGAIVATALTQRRRDATRALVLEDPPGHGGDADEFADGILADAATARLDHQALVARERQANPHWAPEDVEEAVNGIAAADASSIAAGLRGPLRWSLPAMLTEVRVPVLVLVAPDAPGGFLGSASALRGADREAVRRLLPPDTFIVLPGGHCLHRDDPERWLDVVASFATAALAQPHRLAADQKVESR